MEADAAPEQSMRYLHATRPVEDILDPYRRELTGDQTWLRANMVSSLDGSAAIGGRVGDLSDGVDSILFRHMRATADVVLVGAQTVRAEGYGPITLPPPLVAERIESGRAATPPLAIVTASLNLDWSSKLFTSETKPFVITAASADAELLDRARGVAEVIIAGNERVDLAKALSTLASRGHRLVHCEGGPTLLGELVSLDLLDELCLTVAPLMGGDPFPIALSPKSGTLTHFTLEHTAVADDVLFLRYERVRHG